VTVFPRFTDVVAAVALAIEAELDRRAVRPPSGFTTAVASALFAASPTGGTSPAAGRSVVAVLGGSPPGRRLERRWSTSPAIGRRLELAGDPSSRDLAGRVLAGAAFGALVWAAAAWLVGPMLLLAPVGAVAGGRFQLMRLARTARRRQARIDAQVPELVELLVAGTQAGLPPATAFVRSAALVPAPLGDEVRRAAAQVDLGVPWRAALDEAVRRTDAPAFGSMARALARAQRLGGSVHGSLRTIVAELRTERRVRAEELARRAPVKMLFPLVFLILPAFLLLTVGPVLLSTIRSLH